MKETGERIYLKNIDEVVFEHVHRYFFAGKFVKDKVVLDVACGSGYGSNYLAQFATKVYGLDKDAETIQENKIKYQHNNLEFLIGNAEKLPFNDKTFDVVISFETIEHLHNYDMFLSEVKRVLKEDGIFLISTPNKEFSEYQKHENPYHIKEFYEDEFGNILKKYFKNIITFYQSSGFFDVIFPANQSITHYEVLDFNVERIKGGIIIPTDNLMWYKKYFISIASDKHINLINFKVNIANCNYVYQQRLSYIDKVYKSYNYKIGYFLTYPIKWLLHLLNIKKYPDL